MVLFVLSHVSYTMVDEVELLAVAYLRCTIFTPGVSNSVPPPPHLSASQKGRAEYQFYYLFLSCGKALFLEARCGATKIDSQK